MTKGMNECWVFLGICFRILFYYAVMSSLTLPFVGDTSGWMEESYFPRFDVFSCLGI